MENNDNLLQEEMHRLINGRFEHFPNSYINCTTMQSSFIEQLDTLIDKLKDVPKITASITFTNNGLRYFKVMIDVVEVDGCRYVFNSIPIQTVDDNEELEDNEIKVTYNDGSYKIKKWCDYKQLEHLQKAKVISCY